jgi:hypothetical protein
MTVPAEAAQHSTGFEIPFSKAKAGDLTIGNGVANLCEVRAERQPQNSRHILGNFPLNLRRLQDARKVQSSMNRLARSEAEPPIALQYQKHNRDESADQSFANDRCVSPGFFALHKTLTGQ